MTLTEARQRRERVNTDLNNIIRDVANHEGQVETNVNQLRQVFGDRVPEDPTQIDFEGLEKELTDEREKLEGEIDEKLGQAEKLLEDLDERLNSTEGS